MTVKAENNKNSISEWTTQYTVEMENKTMDTILHKPTPEELISENDNRDAFNRECASAFKRVYQLQQLKIKQLTNQVTGVTPSVWSAYGQQSYAKNRSLHIFAVFSWLTQVPIETLCTSRRTLSSSTDWQDADSYMLDIITYVGTLDRHEFACFIRTLQKKIEAQGAVFNQQVLEKLKALTAIGDNFIAPQKIDINTFKADYYRSVALTMKTLRETNDIPQSHIATLMGESLKRYQAYEDPDKPVSLPLYGVMRAIAVLQIKHTIEFVSHMQVYPEFIQARQVQKLRSEILLALLLPLPEPAKIQVLDFIQKLIQFYKY